MTAEETKQRFITINGKSYSVAQEGSASIVTRNGEPKTTKPMLNPTGNNGQGDQNVFYNPIQQFNRDLSVLAVLIYGRSALVEKRRKHENSSKVKQKGRQNARQNEARALTDENTRVDDSNPHGQEIVERLQADSSNVLTEGGAISSAVDEDGCRGTKRKRGDTQDEDCSDTHVAADGVKRPKAGSPENSTTMIKGSDQQAQNQDESQGGEVKENEVQRQSGAQQTEIVQVNGNSHDKSYSQSKRKWPSFSILDALSASGLRAIRYAKEIPFASHIIANDVSHDAVEAIKLNIVHNEVGNVLEPHVGDARTYMYGRQGNEAPSSLNHHTRRFDVIDLDPYGTAAPFFDAALLAIQDGGLLCVTCTDAGVFASNGYPEKAFALYGGTPMKGPHSHEGGLRLILHAISSAAAKYGLAIEPMLSLSIDFYARLFVRIHRRPIDVKLLAGKTMFVYNCDSGCGSWTRQFIGKQTSQQDKKGQEYFKHGFAQGPSTTPHCEHCGFKTHVAGPMWGGPIHNVHFVQRLLDLLPSLDKNIYSTIPRLKGMLTLALEEDLDLPAIPEKPADSPPSETSISDATIPVTSPSAIDPHPFFFNLSYLAKVLRVPTPSDDEFRGALRHLGYRVTRSHCKAMSIRTDAPFDVIWEVLREWARKKAPEKEGAVRPGTAGWEIMKGTRGSEAAKVKKARAVLDERLGKVHGIQDLKSELEAALFRLGRNDDAEGNGEGDTGKADRQRKLNQLEVIFDAKLGRETQRKGLVRYQLNPQPNWGPMNRATDRGGTG
ncbi:MAG: hypothetical protein Q9227_005492 [Pyrenula ochraceoflavens]